jgi:hypothetical protein
MRIVRFSCDICKEEYPEASDFIYGLWMEKDPTGIYRKIKVSENSERYTRHICKDCYGGLKVAPLILKPRCNKRIN